MIRKEAVMVWFVVLSQYLHGKTEKTAKKPLLPQENH
jgi:hypothetical protein